ncbi:MAG: bifunctional ornithine acetyltransferase/N-acetylglutamate synthase [Candidatus Omnitrophica bacterium CG23_combo_of_CG06-09_8_20_14_all_40_11]|nr:MAG: bifunctional ornithine acetyltransferase/N-acetylglutamate synthase [Candidatus Omnitrophica bacterium CG23_combo_of_CG06-09_8_20_14_all_40_11]
MMRIYKKAILPLDFQANGIASGIKKSGKLDLALLYSGIPAKAACQFTSNKIQAAPIRINKKYLKEKRDYQAIIVNSGNANCFTGNRGLRDAEETTQILSKAVGIKKNSVLVASTGIIGKRLPLLKIRNSIPKLVMGLSRYGIDKAKTAILTTDTFAKEITVKFNIGSQIITVCGIAKGAGMIAPNMATMLCFILTDARITQRALSKALGSCVNNSFNCITVDGCQSTNDTIISLANGASRNNLIDTDNKHFNLFLKALNIVCLELAKLIIKDAEGATKFIQIRVEKAKNFTQARHVALNIANSNLFKTAMYGENPNFGRIIAAIGASRVDVGEKDIKMKASPLNKKEIKVAVSIKQGDACATVYTSDLTPEYIKINAEYN